MFKVDDIVTGVDRTYIRSIYLYIEVIDDLTGLYKPIAIRGKDLSNEDVSNFTHPRFHSEFRFASKLEHNKARYASYYSLHYLLNRLGIESATNF